MKIRVLDGRTPISVEFTGTIEIQRGPGGAMVFHKQTYGAEMKVEIEGPDLPEPRGFRLPMLYQEYPLEPPGGDYGSDYYSPYWHKLEPTTELLPLRPFPWVGSYPPVPEGKVEIEVRYLMNLLCDLVEQNCAVENGSRGDIDAGFVACHAEAIRYLCEYGLMTMVNDGYGRCVQAKSIPYMERIRK